MYTLLLLLLLYPSPAMAAYGLSATCNNPDPSNYSDVYKCINSYRWHDGRLGFAPTFSSGDCNGYQTLYAAALRESGIKGVTAHGRKDMMPSCEILAKVKEDMTGKPPYWAACLGFETSKREEHMKQCLTGFLKSYRARGASYTSRDAATELPSCEEALRIYEQGLRNANPDRKYPSTYQRPSCEDVAQVLTAMRNPDTNKKSVSDPQWAACLDYDASDVEKHISRCMKDHTNGLDTCMAVIDAYEQRLRASYGGSFPVGYVRPPCSAGESIAKAARTRPTHEYGFGLDPAKPYLPIWSTQERIYVDERPRFFTYSDRAERNKTKDLQAFDEHIRTTGTGFCLGRSVLSGSRTAEVFHDLPSGQNNITITCVGQCDNIKYAIATNRDNYIYHRGLTEKFPIFIMYGAKPLQVNVGIGFLEDIGGISQESVRQNKGNLELPPDTTIVVELWSYTVAALLRPKYECSHTIRRVLNR